MAKVLSYDDYIVKNLAKYQTFLSWARFYPDLYLEYFKDPANPNSGIQLHFDQRVFIRASVRFMGMYGCFSRGTGKSFNNVLSDMLTCTLYPNIVIAMTAQTKESAARIMKAKYNEIIRYYPLLENETVYARFTRNDAEVKFKNGSIYKCLAESENSKGERAHRIRRDESALSNEEVFLDAIKPIVEVPRVLTGKARIPNPEELNGQIHSFSTPTWRGSDEFNRCIVMENGMCENNGDFVIGGCWMLPSWFGRGSTKEQIILKAKSYSPTQFAMNYMARWCGSASGALIPIRKLLKCRNLENAELHGVEDGEYYMAVDVARSESDSNNKTSITIGKVIRSSDGKVLSIEVVNVFNVSNTANFTSQALIVKRTRKRYNAKVCVVDGNGLGAGLVDTLLMENYDPDTGETLECWDTINTSNMPAVAGADACVYDLKAQSAQSKILTDLIDVFDSGLIRLLVQKQYDMSESLANENYTEERMPYVQTDLLMEELTNLRLETGGRNLMIRKNSSKIDKDRASSLMYLVYYILEYANAKHTGYDADWSEIFTARMPRFR